MRYPSERTIRRARRFVSIYLQDRTRAIMLFDVTSAVDGFLRHKGRKNDLFESLFDYEVLIPADWTCRWMGKGGTSDSLYCAVPRASLDKPQPSPSLLTGSGTVRVVDAPD